MNQKNNAPEMNIFRPVNLRELLSYIYLNPEAALVGGGINFMRSLKEKTSEPGLPEKVVDLTTVSELKKMNKTMRYLDLGAALSLSRILGIRYHVVPIVLHNALKSVSGPSIRNLATLGGNICQVSPYSSIVPALGVLDAHLEIRSFTAFRWEPVTTFIKAAPRLPESPKAESGKTEAQLPAAAERAEVTPALLGTSPSGQPQGEEGAKKTLFNDSAVRTSLARDEVVARVRIPLDSWNVQVYKKITNGFNSPQAAVIFCGLAQLGKGVIEDFRFAFGAVNPTVYRNRNLEKPFIGRKVPLQPKEIELLKEALDAALNPFDDQAFSAAYRKRTALKLIEWFLKSLKPA